LRDRIRSQIEALYRALVTNRGQTSSELRKTLEAYGARLRGARLEASALPKELETYADKVARYAYRVTDEDIEGLKESGYTEDQIYEITLCLAIGAGLGRLEHGLSVLEESHNALANPRE
jgi:hypothetical protein